MGRLLSIGIDTVSAIIVLLPIMLILRYVIVCIMGLKPSPSGETFR